MLESNRRSSKPSKRRTNRRQSRQTGERFQSTAQAARLTVRKRASHTWDTPLTFEHAFEKSRKRRRKPQNRRSKARLGSQKKRVPRGRLRAAILEPVGNALRLNGNTMFNVLFLGLLGWGLAWFFVSDQFYVNQVAVVGNQRVSVEAILGASGIQNYSVFWINPRDIVSNITQALPPVKQVRIRYGLPNVVSLDIEEQGEQVMWQVAGRRYWVDDDGELHPAQGQNEPRLLVKDIRPGLPTQVDTEAMVAAQQLTYLLPELRTMEYAPITGLRFMHSRGWVVYLGTGDDMARKVSVLRAIEVQFSGEGTNQPLLIDLRFPDSPYYRFPGEGTGGV